MHCIYKIWFKNNRYFYIGSTVDFNIRYTSHIRDLRKQSHKNRKLQNITNKYGIDNLIIEPVVFCIPDLNRKTLIRDIEQIYIDKYTNDKYLINISKNTTNPADLGRYFANHKSKNVTLQSPSGKTITYLNIRKFCRTFNLYRRKIYEVLNGKRTSHKGWVLPNMFTSNSNQKITLIFKKLNFKINLV